MIATNIQVNYGPRASVTRICRSLIFQRVARLSRSVTRLSKSLILNDSERDARAPRYYVPFGGWPLGAATRLETSEARGRDGSGGRFPAASQSAFAFLATPRDGFRPPNTRTAARSISLFFIQGSTTISGWLVHVARCTSLALYHPRPRRYFDTTHLSS